LKINNGKVTWSCYNSSSSKECSLKIIDCNSQYNGKTVNKDTLPKDNSLCVTGKLVDNSFSDDGKGNISWKCGTYHSKYVE